MAVEATANITTPAVVAPVTTPVVKPEAPKGETSGTVATGAPAATVAPELGKKLYIMA